MSSKGERNWASRSWIRKGHPGLVRRGGAAGEVDPSRGELDEEEDVEALEKDRLHREEVTGQKA